MMNSTTTERQDYSTDLQFIYKVDGIWAMTMMCIATIPNGILIFVEGHHWWSRRQIILPRLLILVLASSDVIAIVLGITATITMWFNWQTTAGCLYSQFVVTTFMTFSKIVVILMGVERYLALRKPFLYVACCGIKTFSFVLLVFFLYSLGFGSFAVVAYSDVIHHYALYSACFHGEMHTLFKQWAAEMWCLVQELVLISALSFSNISVMYTIREMKRNVITFCPRDRLEFIRQLDMICGTGREFFRLMLAINIVFFILTTPHAIRILMNEMNILNSEVSDFMAWRMSLSNGMINPFLYGFLRKTIRLKIRNFFRNIFKCKFNKVAPVLRLEVIHSSAHVS